MLVFLTFSFMHFGLIVWRELGCNMKVDCNLDAHIVSTESISFFLVYFVFSLS